MGTVIVITSGKGGTGKTAFTGGVAASLAQRGHKVLCIDADIGLRNLDISLGMTDAVLMDFTDVMDGRCALLPAAALHPSISRLFLLTAPISLPSEPLAQEGFRALLKEARAHFDYILIDCPAGLGPGFHLATCDADQAVIVSTSDTSALRDAQRVVAQIGTKVSLIRLVVNRVQPKLLKRLSSTIDDMMDFVGLPLLGLVPEDAQVMLAANEGRALLQGGYGEAANAYRNIATRITGERMPLSKIR